MVFLYSRQGMSQYQTLDEIVLNAPNYFQASEQAKLLIEQNDSIPLSDLKRFYRWEWFYRNHIDATGNFTQADTTRFKNIIKLINQRFSSGLPSDPIPGFPQLMN